MNRVVRFERRGGGEGARPRLGEILVQRRALEPARLSQALACQPKSGRRLGDVLVAQGWASGGAVAGALAEQWGVEVVDLEAEPAAGALVRPELAELYLSGEATFLGECSLWVGQWTQSAAAVESLFCSIYRR